MTVVPLMPDFISGMIKLRANVVPVVNLAWCIEYQLKAIGNLTSIVIIDIKDEDGEHVEISMVVDVVNEVIELADSDIATAPTFGVRIRSDFIQVMGKIEDKLIILLDINHV